MPEEVQHLRPTVRPSRGVTGRSATELGEGLGVSARVQRRPDAQVASVGVREQLGRAAIGRDPFLDLRSRSLMSAMSIPWKSAVA